MSRYNQGFIRSIVGNWNEGDKHDTTLNSFRTALIECQICMNCSMEHEDHIEEKCLFTSTNYKSYVESPTRSEH